jgi:hypothetical protein
MARAVVDGADAVVVGNACLPHAGCRAGGLSGPAVTGHCCVAEVVRAVPGASVVRGGIWTLPMLGRSPRCPGRPDRHRAVPRPDYRVPDRRRMGRADRDRDRQGARPTRRRARSHLGARLHAAMQDRGPLCASIDPHPGLLRAWGLDDVAGLERFALTAADAAPRVAIEAQSAFRAVRSRGIAVLERLVTTCRDAGPSSCWTSSEATSAPPARRTPTPTSIRPHRWPPTRSRQVRISASGHWSPWWTRPGSTTQASSCSP